MDVVTLEQASEITGLTVKTLRNLRSLGQGPPSFLLRRRIRYYRADVTAWIDAAAGRTNVTPIRRIS